MRRALELAARGLGRVEPNPPVGAVVVDGDLRLLGEGFHERYGGPHAEVNAIETCGAIPSGATLYVTLEPCAHHGKTPPCTEFVINSGIRKAVIAVRDPAPHGQGAGVHRLREAGIEVDVGLLSHEAGALIAPFRCLVKEGRPYVHAKWAMTLDGRMGTRTGDSKWISSEESREIVHGLRGRMDAVIVGIGTVLADDPLLTARPAGPRTATRIVLDRHARTPVDSRLVRSIDEAAILVAVGDDAPVNRIERLAEAGVEVVRLPAGSGGGVRIGDLLQELGRRKMTNVLVEGGGRVLGSFFDAGLIDACHVFIAPKLTGGTANPIPNHGAGCEWMQGAAGLCDVTVAQPGGDVYLRGVLDRSAESGSTDDDIGEPVGDQQDENANPRDGGKPAPQRKS